MTVTASLAPLDHYTEYKRLSVCLTGSLLYSRYCSLSNLPDFAGEGVRGKLVIPQRSGQKASPFKAAVA